jgi:histidinol-phosphate aminotransferase
VGPKKLIEAMFKVKDSYNVDAVAQAVALAAVKDRGWMERNVARVKATRRRFTAELIRRGWDVMPSETNFVFAKPPAGENAAEIFARLKAENVFVRYFPGPKTGDRLRITVGTDAEMKKLLKKI